MLLFNHEKPVWVTIQAVGVSLVIFTYIKHRHAPRGAGVMYVGHAMCELVQWGMQKI
jgi:hypothetical protein